MPGWVCPSQNSDIVSLLVVAYGHSIVLPSFTYLFILAWSSLSTFSFELLNYWIMDVEVDLPFGCFRVPVLRCLRDWTLEVAICESLCDYRTGSSLR